MKNIEIKKRVEEACEDYKLYSADCDCVVFVNDFKINGNNPHDYKLSTDGEALSEECFSLRRGQSIYAGGKLTEGLLIGAFFDIIQKKSSEDVDFLLDKVSVLMAMNKEKENKLLTYRIKLNDALNAYDALSNPLNLLKGSVPARALRKILRHNRR